MKSFSCLRCQSAKRKCSVRDLLKQLSASRELATTLDLASIKISKPEHVNELGVSRETAIVLGQILSVKKEVISLNHRMGRKVTELSRRLDSLEHHFGIGDSSDNQGGVGEVGDGPENVNLWDQVAEGVGSRD